MYHLTILIGATELLIPEADENQLKYPNIIMSIQKY